MRRYGDNVTKEDLFEETQSSTMGERSYLFLGGCAATYGAFPMPEKPKKVANKKNMLAELLMFLSGKRKNETGTL